MRQALLKCNVSCTQMMRQVLLKCDVSCTQMMRQVIISDTSVGMTPKTFITKPVSMIRD